MKTSHLPLRKTGENGRKSEARLKENCILTRYLPISVDPDRCWLPYGAEAPVLPFLTCEEGMREGGREGERSRERGKKRKGRGEVKDGRREAAPMVSPITSHRATATR